MYKMAYRFVREVNTSHRHRRSRRLRPRTHCLPRLSCGLRRRKPRPRTHHSTGDF